MTAPLVTYAVDDRVGIVTLNRPDKLNAISPELKRMLVERFHEADRDPGHQRGRAPRRGPELLRRLRHLPEPGPGGAAGQRAGLARVAHRRRRPRDDAVGHDEAGDRLRPGPLSRRGLRAGDAVRPHHRRRRCRLRRAGDPLLQRRPRPRHALRHRATSAPASCSTSATPSTRRRRSRTAWSTASFPAAISRRRR